MTTPHRQALATASRTSGESLTRSRAERSAPIHAESPPNAPHYRVMFTVPFRTAMSDCDIHRLRSVLGMSAHLQPKLHKSPASPGVSRLDLFSGLFLLRGERPGDWRLEGRTWGAPAPEAVHGWHLVAAEAARLVDPGVPVCRGLRPLGSEGGRSAPPRLVASPQPPMTAVPERPGATSAAETADNSIFSRGCSATAVIGETRQATRSRRRAATPGPDRRRRLRTAVAPEHQNVANALAFGRSQFSTSSKWA
jgi:hypothetical protein